MRLQGPSVGRGRGGTTPSGHRGGREPAAGLLFRTELQSKFLSPALPRPPETWASGMSPRQLPIPPTRGCQVHPRAPLCSATEPTHGHPAPPASLPVLSLLVANLIWQRRTDGSLLVINLSWAFLPQLLPDPPLLSVSRCSEAFTAHNKH